MKRIIMTAVTVALALISCGQAVNQDKTNEIAIRGDFMDVIIPELPEVLNFAGERVSLENYDTRESLERELLATIYTHSKTSLILLNSKRYFSIIEPILARNGIPNDFKYLCVAESGLDPNAVSVAKAAGLWQIMSTTGKSYDLKIGDEIDERFHFEKATEAACKILKDNYTKLGSWTLSAAAYNLGINGVQRRIDKQQVRDYYDSYFPQETLRYLFRILAYKVFMENPEKYGYDTSNYVYHKPFDSYDEIKVTGLKIDWSDVARKNGTTYKQLRELNQWIRDYDYENKKNDTLTVRIPKSDFRTKR